MKYLFILTGVVCLSFMLLPACAPEPVQEAEPVTEEAPSIAADLETIKAIPKQWEAAYHSDNLEKLMPLYAQNAVRMPPDVPILDGKEAIRSAFELVFSEFKSEGEIVVLDAKVSGDLGYLRGTYIGTATPKAGGDPIEYDNKFVVVCQRQADGSWKTISEIWNDNPPPE